MCSSGKVFSSIIEKNQTDWGIFKVILLQQIKIQTQCKQSRKSIIDSKPLNHLFERVSIIISYKQKKKNQKKSLLLFSHQPNNKEKQRQSIDSAKI